MTDFIKLLYDKFDQSSKEYLALRGQIAAVKAEIQRTGAKIEGIRGLLRLEGVEAESLQKNEISRVMTNPKVKIHP